MIASIILVVVIVLFVLWCPIFKPWFGFRKPYGHEGKWFQ